MFCPNCGDCRGTVVCVDMRNNTYRCRICGHVFYYKLRPLLEKKFGKGSHDYTFDWAKEPAKEEL
jgi:DNA-directed RNA polymerase subunit RPC12/RpoP